MRGRSVRDVRRRVVQHDLQDRVRRALPFCFASTAVPSLRQYLTLRFSSGYCLSALLLLPFLLVFKDSALTCGPPQVRWLELGLAFHLRHCDLRGRLHVPRHRSGIGTADTARMLCSPSDSGQCPRQTERCQQISDSTGISARHAALHRRRGRAAEP